MFSEKLLKMRDGRGLSQAKLAARAGLARSAISDMEKDERRPYMDQALKLARALGIPLDFLADDSLDEPPPSEMTEDERQVIELFRGTGLE